MGFSLSIIWLAIAVSLDSLGVGITYGMRRIRLPLRSVCLIAACSGSLFCVALQLGNQLKQLFSPSLVQEVGIVIFILLGGWTIFQSMNLSSEKEALPANSPKPKVWKFEIPTIGLVIQILKTPLAADVDRSGSISGWEAVLLGTALSLDAFGAGLGAAMFHLPALPLSLFVALTSISFLVVGTWIGFRYTRQQFWMRYLSWIPGVILILIGISRLFT